MADKKKFGLVMPKKTDKLKMRFNVFNDDSDDDEKSNKRPKIPQTKTKVNTEIVDSSIYEYDNIYDEMKAKQTENITPKAKKESRYIETLLKAADKRKNEYERRIDRKIQTEREKEGDQFKDKEAFVTTSYKKKMQEKEEEEERERRENMLNDMMDVTKQKDLSGFYKHFLNQTVGDEKVPVFGEKQINKNIVIDVGETSKKVCESPKAINIDQDSDGVEIDNDDNSENSSSEKSIDYNKATLKIDSKYSKPRHKRIKCNSDTESKMIQCPEQSKSRFTNRSGTSNVDTNSSDDEINDANEKRVIGKIYKQKDKKADNFKHKSRHDSSSSDSESDKLAVDPNKDKINYAAKKSANAGKHKIRSGQETGKHNFKEKSSSSNDGPCNKSTIENINSIKSENERQAKVNIYVKRTIGDVFTAAQARYFQRMAARNSGL